MEFWLSRGHPSLPEPYIEMDMNTSDVGTLVIAKCLQRLWRGTTPVCHTIKLFPEAKINLLEYCRYVPQCGTIRECHTKLSKYGKQYAD